MRGGKMTCGLPARPHGASAWAHAGQRLGRGDRRWQPGRAGGGIRPLRRGLNLRHELDSADLADALGVPRNHAHALASRARGQFEISLGALLVARSGRATCPDLDDLLAGWDGRLTVLLRKRLNRHIEHCDGCGERKRRELRPAMLLGLLPVVALPNSLRHQVLGLVADDTPRGAAYRAHVTRRSEPFGPNGFPVPIDPPAPPRVPRRYGLLAGAAAAAAFAVLGGIVVAMAQLHGGGPRHAADRAHTALPTPLPQAQAASPVSPGPATHSPDPAAVTTVPAPPAPPPPVATARPTPAPRRTPGARPTPTPRPSPSSSGTPTPAQGTLTVSTTAVTLAPVGEGFPTGSFTLTASGGPVTYTIAVPATVSGLVVMPSSGTLAAGASIPIMVTWNSGLTLNTQLTVAPGGLVVAVSYRSPLT